MAPNIFYIGRAGLVNFGGLRIGGVSGIYKSHDYYKGIGVNSTCFEYVNGSL